MSFRSSPRVGSALLVLGLAASCASVEFTRETQTSGRFVGRGFAVTLFSYDIPSPAIVIARDNIADARLTNYQVDEATVWPYWGWFDFVLDIVGVRWAVVKGTWGFDGSESAGTAPVK